MKLHEPNKDFEILLFDDEIHDPNSVDNVKKYNHIYSDSNYDDYSYLTKHGIEILKNDDLINSALVISDGGPTGVHDSCSLIDNDKLLICCGHSIFCMILPNLQLLWRTTADTATCFEIFKHENDFIVHGELEISKLSNEGNIIWKFSGGDIFTTLAGKNTFNIIDNIIYATDWDNITYKLNADSGELLK